MSRCVLRPSATRKAWRPCDSRGRPCDVLRGLYTADTTDNKKNTNMELSHINRIAGVAVQ